MKHFIFIELISKYAMYNRFYPVVRGLFDKPNLNLTGAKI
tara:strand:+ start:5188 stop:5307 length:120 start_codon:yes stop_codon:yes gene_type:complete